MRETITHKAMDLLILAYRAVREIENIKTSEKDYKEKITEILCTENMKTQED